MAISTSKIRVGRPIVNDFMTVRAVEAQVLPIGDVQSCWMILVNRTVNGIMDMLITINTVYCDRVSG